MISDAARGVHVHVTATAANPKVTLAQVVRLNRVHGRQDGRQHGRLLHFGASLRLIEAALMKRVALEELGLVLPEADSVRTIFESAQLLQAVVIHGGLALPSREQILINAKQRLLIVYE